MRTPADGYDVEGESRMTNFLARLMIDNVVSPLYGLTNDESWVTAMKEAAYQQS